MTTPPRTEPIFLTAEQAESLLEDGEYVHNFIGGAALIGCDYSREGAVEAFKDAQEIQVGGGIWYRLGHPLAVLDQKGRRSFFAADMGKVAAFEAALSQ